uniref:Uncharacterized protein n=1 Tax=viral metagenome TaxID=1070528 RepID=A0A6C0H533_9ZZZZ
MNIYFLSFISSIIFVILSYSYNKYLKNNEKKDDSVINGIFVFLSIVIVDFIKNKYLNNNNEPEYDVLDVKSTF